MKKYMKDFCKQLYDLSNRKVCGNCFHFNLCLKKLEDDLEGFTYKDEILKSAPNREVKNCEFYKDKSRILELPCEIGNEVYIIRSAKPVTNLYYINQYCAIGFSDVEIFLLDPNERIVRICRDCKNIYYDKATAQSKLKELNDKCQ